MHLGLKARGEGGVRVVSRNQLRQAALVSLSPRVELDSRSESWRGRRGSRARRSASLGTRCEDGGKPGHCTLLTSEYHAVPQCHLQRRCRRGFRDRVWETAAVRRSCLKEGSERFSSTFPERASSNARAKVKMAVGGITLRLPRAAGVRITMDKFLSSFEAAGLVRRDGAFVSPEL